jgi:Lar family restriction alleviation protein
MSDDLKPCPFCGGKDVDGKMHKDGRVHCYRCGADGPAVPYAHDDKAFTWNNRTTLAEFDEFLKTKEVQK